MSNLWQLSNRVKQALSQTSVKLAPQPIGVINTPPPPPAAADKRHVLDRRHTSAGTYLRGRLMRRWGYANSSPGWVRPAPQWLAWCRSSARPPLGRWCSATGCQIYHHRVVPGAGDVPARSRVGSDQRLGGWGGAVHQPDCRLAVGVLPQNVGLAVAVEIARPGHVPARPWVRPDQGFAGRCGPVHQPDRSLAIGVLPQNVGFAVIGEVAGRTNHLPARSRIWPDQRFAGGRGAVHQPDRRLAVGVLPQNVGGAATGEIIGRRLARDRQKSKIGGVQAARIGAGRHDLAGSRHRPVGHPKLQIGRWRHSHRSARHCRWR